MTPRTFVSACAAAVVALAAACSLAAEAPRPMPAHPDLLKQLGGARVAKLQQKTYTPRMAADLRIMRTDKAAAAVTGTGACLVILWEFTDHPADQANHPASAYDDMMFSTGTFPTGSMNDYYREVSYGQYGVGGLVTNWTTAASTYASYANGDGSQDSYTARAMLQDAIVALDPVVDFSQYDNDGPDGIPDSGDDDGLVDALFFVHAGPGQEQSGDIHDIWSHAWALPGGQATNDGVRVYRYSVEPEEFTNGDQITVGVFAHEYGHVLGLPDLYDTDYSVPGHRRVGPDVRRQLDQARRRRRRQQPLPHDRLVQDAAGLADAGGDHQRPAGPDRGARRDQPRGLQACSRTGSPARTSTICSRTAAAWASTKAWCAGSSPSATTTPRA